MTEDPDKERGMYGRYYVERLDGSTSHGGKHHDCDFFVLDLVHDKFAYAALYVYATVCESEYPQLAADIRKRLSVML